MEDQRPTVHQLLCEIAGGDFLHGVFRVSVHTSDISADFTATATMRADDGLLSWSDATPEDALIGLKKLLQQTYGVCPYCGQHLNVETKR